MVKSALPSLRQGWRTEPRAGRASCGWTGASSAPELLLQPVSVRLHLPFPRAGSQFNGYHWKLSEILIFQTFCGGEIAHLITGKGEYWAIEKQFVFQSTVAWWSQFFSPTPESSNKGFLAILGPSFSDHACPNGHAAIYSCYLCHLMGAFTEQVQRGMGSQAAGPGRGVSMHSTFLNSDRRRSQRWNSDSNFEF